MKTCKTCGEEKPLDDFPDGAGYAGGKRPHCKPCHLESNNRTTDRVKDRDQKLKKLYGIGVKEYDIMLSKQQGCCAICGKPADEFKKALAVDHDHLTGEVRGLLCSNCNTGIGNLRDDIGMLYRAIEYLGG
jgi:hypothetical protein